MVNCSHCDKELDRNVFCNASCKTMFHRGYTKATPVPITNTTEGVKTMLDVCKHGAIKGLCKKGCR